MKRFEAVAKNAESPSSVVWGSKINNKINNTPTSTKQQPNTIKPLTCKQQTITMQAHTPRHNGQALGGVVAS